MTEASPDNPAERSVLLEANDIVFGEKTREYGPPELVFNRYARGWSIILGVDVTSEQVAMCMIWLKMMREKNRHNRDNLVDIAGSDAILGRIIEYADRVEHPPPPPQAARPLSPDKRGH